MTYLKYDMHVHVATVSLKVGMGWGHGSPHGGAAHRACKPGHAYGGKHANAASKMARSLFSAGLGGRPPTPQ